MSPSISSADVAASISSGARRCLQEGMDRIEHCLNQLDDEQVWWLPGPRMNSIANLLLHLTGNLRQWVISGLGGADDVRNRPAEFNARDRRPKAELLALLKSTVSDCDQVLARLTAQDLTGLRRVQGFDLTGAAVLWDTIPHFRGHVQEILHVTRVILGDSYKFAFVPEGPEQQTVSGPAL